MSEESMSRDEVLAQLNDDWSEFLNDFDSLDILQRDDYFKTKKQKTLKDLLICICGYWSGTSGITIGLLQNGLFLSDLQSAEKVQADSVENAVDVYQKNFPYEEKDFRMLFFEELNTFTQFVKTLPEDAWDNEAFHFMVLNATLILYEECFRLPRKTVQ